MHSVGWRRGTCTVQLIKYFTGQLYKNLHCAYVIQLESAYRIVGNFRGSEFRSFVAICEKIFHKIWIMASFGLAKASNPWESSFLRKIVFFTNSWKFSPSKVSRYMVNDHWDRLSNLWISLHTQINLWQLDKPLTSSHSPQLPVCSCWFNHTC